MLVEGVVVLGVVRFIVPLLGAQLIATPDPAVGAAPAAAAVPTCDGAGVTAVGCEAVGVGAVAVVLVPVEVDCGMVPAGHGDEPLAPSPPTVDVLAPGDVPGIAVVLAPGVVVAAPGVVVAAPGEVPGRAVLLEPGVVVWVPGAVPGMAVLFMPGVTPGVVVWVPVGVAIVVPGVVVVVWPAVAGVVDVDMPVCPAVAGALVVPAALPVPMVCA